MDLSIDHAIYDLAPAHADYYHAVVDMQKWYGLWKVIYPILIMPKVWWGLLVLQLQYDKISR